MRTLVKIFLLNLILIIFVQCKNQNEVGEGQKETQGSETKAADAAQKMILFYGNSITAGYGLDLSEAFPALIQKKIDSLDLNYKVINAGVSGETSSAGLNRLDWVLKQKVDIFVLELGANDGLRGIKLEETKRNLQGIIDKVKAENPQVKIVLAGMEMPPSMGKEYTMEFRQMYKDLASENKVYFIPFLLEGVGGEPTLNLPDGIHPTAEGHQLLSENVWKVLKGIL